MNLRTIACCLGVWGTAMLLAGLISWNERRALPNPAVLQQHVNSFDSLQGKQGLPGRFLERQDKWMAYLVREPGDFDVMRYFDVLVHLSMDSGFVLDYFCMNRDGNGRPIRYARRVEDAPFHPAG